MCEHPGRGKGGGGSKGGNRRRSVHSDFGNLGLVSPLEPGTCRGDGAAIGELLPEANEEAPNPRSRSVLKCGATARDFALPCGRGSCTPG